MYYSVLEQIKLAAVLSEKVNWAEEVEMNWFKTLTRYDLVALRDFFRDGVQVQVIEEKVAFQTMHSHDLWTYLWKSYLTCLFASL